MVVIAGVEMTHVLERRGAIRWTRRAHDPLERFLYVACNCVLYR